MIFLKKLFCVLLCCLGGAGLLVGTGLLASNSLLVAYAYSLASGASSHKAPTKICAAFS